MRRTALFLLLVFVAACVFACTTEDDQLWEDADLNTNATPASTNSGPITDEQDLGGALFFDENLGGGGVSATGFRPAVPALGQNCADCHSAATGFADPAQSVPVSQGVVPGVFGPRNAPTVAYASYSPPLHPELDPGRGQVYVGGYFRDGRAMTLAAQAIGPLLSPYEMNNSSCGQIIDKVKLSNYVFKFEKIYGEGSLEDADTVRTCQRMQSALAAYEDSLAFNRFSSRYDYWMAGYTSLEENEERGRVLFSSKCAECHPDDLSAAGVAPVFTNYSFHNIGIPRNPANPFYTLPPELNPDGWAYEDLGLGGFLGTATEDGKFKVPTLRNVALTAPYGHNGNFMTLHSIIAFKNTRDVPGAGWPTPEIPRNLETLDIGNMGLTEADIEDLTAFLTTLTDGFGPPLGERLDRLNR